MSVPAGLRSCLLALRQWPQQNLANSFALQAATMVLLSVLVIAGVSVAIFYWSEVGASVAELNRKAERAVDRVETQVEVLEKNVAEFSRSPAFTTAMMDTSASSTYLGSFLLDYSFPVFARNGLAPCDTEGQRLVGTQNLSECHATLPQFRQVLADGRVRRAVIHGEGGRGADRFE